MANIRIIKRRIQSANNISQITRAMQMVAASKMKKAQQVAIAGKPYARKIHEAVARFSQTVNKKLHPLFTSYPQAKRVLAILVSTNKGLCGGLNSNLFRQISNWFEQEKIVYITLGIKGRNFVRSTKSTLLADFSDKEFIETVPAVIQLTVEEYNKGIYRRIYVLYNTFVSSFQYDPTRVALLPLEKALSALRSGEEDQQDQDEKITDVIIEPSHQALLTALIPHYLEIQVRRSILESEASEHSARMIAMKNATDSAQDLKEELTLEYNKIRQQHITYEIADMVTARMAVE